MKPEPCPFGTCPGEAQVISKTVSACPVCNRVWETEFTEKFREKYGAEKPKGNDE